MSDLRFGEEGGHDPYLVSGVTLMNHAAQGIFSLETKTTTATLIITKLSQAGLGMIFQAGS